MNDNLLIANVIAVLKTGFQSRSISVGIKQNYQPTQQGSPSGPAVFLHKIADKLYGFPERLDRWNANTASMDHTENQLLETTYQVNATAIQIPSNTTQLTSGDYLRIAARILGSDAAVKTLKDNGISVRRIMALRVTTFTDEKGQYEAEPSFDFTVGHLETETTTVTSTDVVVETIAVIT